MAANELAAAIEQRLEFLRQQKSKVSEQATADQSETPRKAAEGAEDAVAAALETARSAAAVIGSFEPDEIVQSGSDEIRRTVLTRLFAECSVMPGADTSQFRWIMLEPGRTATLRSLQEKKAIVHAIDAAPRPTDAYGKALQEVLRDQAWSDTMERSSEGLLALSAAIDSVRAAGIPVPDAGAIRAKIGRSTFLTDYKVLLSDGFFGRGQQIEKINAFLAESSPDAWWQGLVLSGVGGSGKSTLLAEFLNGVVANKAATAAVLDFDRPGIDASDTQFLELEITRQAGYQWPDLETQLHEARAKIRAYRSLEPSTASDPDGKSSERGFRSLLSEMGQALRSAGHDDKPLLLVLDTFEEVVTQGLAGRIFDWLNEITDVMQPVPIKVVFSGRLSGQALDGSVMQVTDAFPPYVRNALRTMFIDELPRDASAKVIQSVGGPPAAAKSMVASKILPRRPLELKLLGRLLADDRTMTVAELERDLKAGGAKGKQLFTGLIYRRVLMRIKDKLARKLAHPGLILRWVTVDTVVHILAPALELNISTGEAKQALDALASREWLAYKAVDGAVWHRRDVRRSMLPAMHSENRQVARRIHELAIEFFSRSRSDRERAEATYHRLMLAETPEDTAEFELGVLKSDAAFFASDIADFSAPAAAIVQLAQKGSVSPENVWLLPQRYFLDAYEHSGRRLAASREYLSAKLLMDRKTLSGLRGEEPRLRSTGATFSVMEDSWEIETLYATAEWEKLRSVANRWRPEKFTSVRSLSAALYPFEVAFPTQIDGQRLRYQVDEDAILGSAESAGPDHSVQLSRVALGLSLVRVRSSLAEPVRELCGRLADMRRRSHGRPGLDLRQLLLHAISGQNSPAKLWISVSNLRLDAIWLAQFSERLSIKGQLGVKELVDDALVAVQNALEHPPSSARRFLNGIDAARVRESEKNSLMDFYPDEWGADEASRFFGGPVPELRDPARFSLATLCEQDHDREWLAEMIPASLPFKFRDFSPGRLRSALADNPVKTLEMAIELVDRCGTLRSLLEAGAERKPESTIAVVLEAFNRIQFAVQQMLGPRSRFQN